MNWIKIVIAAMFEVGWVVGLTHASSRIEWLLTAIAIVPKFLSINQCVQKFACWYGICSICGIRNNRCYDI